jgi:hypothetical protein
MNQESPRQITREEGQRLVARVWLDALEETARDFHGSHPSAFVTRAYGHSTESFLRILDNEFGIRVKKASTIKEAVENYIEFGVRVYLFDDPSQFQLQERGSHSLEIVTLACPFLSSCKDLLEKGLSLRDLTCPRIGSFRAAVEILTGIKCDYEVTSVRLDEGCTGIIEAV